MALHIDLPPDSHGVLNTSQLFCIHGVVTFSLKAHLRRQLFQNVSYLCLRLSNFSKLSCGMRLCLSEHIVFHLLYSPHVLEEKVHQNKNILHLTPMMLQGLTRGYATYWVLSHLLTERLLLLYRSNQKCQYEVVDL